MSRGSRSRRHPHVKRPHRESRERECSTERAVSRGRSTITLSQPQKLAKHFKQYGCTAESAFVFLVHFLLSDRDLHNFSNSKINCSVQL